ncbi:MAG: hypothetical protein JO303_02265 [Caulobacteraceae bacterium]|nr:hypothetical protein [Caulobacteraceae bacterium]
MATAIEREGGLIEAIDHLNTRGRLTPIKPLRLGPIAGFIAAFHIGDPAGTDDLWRPLRRRRLLERQVKAIAQEGERPEIAPRLAGVTPPG